MTIEDRLHHFTRAIDDAMRPVRPLDLPPTPESGPPARRRAHGGRRWPGLLVPLSAGVAVAATAATLVVVRDLPRAAMRPPGIAATWPGPAGSGAATDPEALPAYFVALSHPQAGMPGPGGGVSTKPPPDPVVVGETRTGRVLATVAPPAGATFAGVTGAADNRTFVLDAMPRQDNPVSVGPRTWYLLRVSPGAATPARLVKLPIPSIAGRDAIEGIALSPDGAKLAVLFQQGAEQFQFQQGAGSPAAGPFTLRVYAVANGALVHGWTGTDPYHGTYFYGSAPPPDDNRTLSWTADGHRLAFAYRSSKSPDPGVYLRMVNLTRPGADLFADSTVIVETVATGTTAKSAISCETLGITADGRTAVCGANLPRVPRTGIVLDAYPRPADWGGCAKPTDLNYPGIAEVSLASRKLTRVLYQVKPKCMGNGTSTVLWASPSGQEVLSYIGYTDDPSMRPHTEVVLASHGTITRLTWPGAAALLYYAAF
jgi:hypothetical protein